MDVDSINKDIGRRIRNLRNRNGLTQQELADRAELTKGFITQLERGQVSASVATADSGSCPWPRSFRWSRCSW